MSSTSIPRKAQPQQRSNFQKLSNFVASVFPFGSAAARQAEANAASALAPRKKLSDIDAILHENQSLSLTSKTSIGL